MSSPEPPVVCPSCKTALPGVAVFCMQCGTRLVQPEGRASRARQTVSVLFSDVVDSTALIERLLREAISRLNSELRSDWSTELRLRTAVHTDSLEVPEGSSVRVEIVTPLTTGGKRLQTAAEAEEILISQATYRLVRDVVRAEPIGPLRLKGIEAPMPALRVLGLRAHIPTSATPLIGRGQELALLSWMYDWAVSQQHCYLVYVLVLQPQFLGSGVSSLVVASAGASLMAAPPG